MIYRTVLGQAWGSFFMGILAIEDCPIHPNTVINMRKTLTQNH